jgi:major membrane immunogen (membrane-anchored lipoprotein)
MTKKFFLILLIPLLLLSSCSKDYVNDSEGQIPFPEHSPVLTDGEYFASFEHGNNEGYRPEMTVTVKEGLITRVNYREVSLDGKDKISDAEYFEAFKEEHNLDLQALYLRLYTNLIKNQSTNSLPSTGDFPDMRNYFKKLSDSIILSARRGLTDPSLISMDDIYYETGEYDSNGYNGRISITYINNVIIDVKYTEMNQNDEPKEDMVDLNEVYQQHYGMSLGEMFDLYTNQIIQNNSIASLDSITGATRTQEKINSLLDSIRERRFPFEMEKADD